MATSSLFLFHPAKERLSSYNTSEDSSKFDNPWRRDGPLPDLPNSRDLPRRKGEGQGQGPPERLSNISDGVNDWRSQRSSKVLEPEVPKRKGSGFLNPESSNADKGDTWTIGSKFKPSSTEEGQGSKFGGPRAKPETTHSAADEGDWRGAPRTRPAARSNASRKWQLHPEVNDSSLSSSQ